MNQLQVIQRDGQLLVDSRNVSEMTGVRHTHLLDKIGGYVDIIENSTEPKIRSSDFFLFSTYLDSTGRTLPCYLLTRKGCDMVANKMTGEKGVLFTAAYVTKFEEMEKAQAINLTGLSPQLQILIQQEQQIKQIKSQVDTLTHGLTATPDHTKVVQRVNEYARWTRTGHNEVYNRIYDVMKARFGIDVKTRAENERDRIDQEYFERTGKHYSLSTLKKKVNGIDVMVRMGVLDKFNEILVGMLAAAKKTG